jgi:hypothetical protein
MVYVEERTIPATLLAKGAIQMADQKPVTAVPDLPDPDGTMLAIELELARIEFDIAEQMHRYHAAIDPLRSNRAFLRHQLAEVKRLSVRKAG